MKNNRFDIVTIGTATRDAFLKSDDFEVITSEAFSTGKGGCFSLGSKIEVKDIFFSTGGGAVNAATTFARFGYKAACVCKVGQDASGKTVIEDLKKEKVEIKFVAQEPEKATAYSIILIAPTGERTILVHRGASEDLTEDNIPGDLQSEWLYLAPLGGENAKIFEPILNWASEKNIKIAVNPSRSQLELGLNKLRPLLRKVSVFILNQEEAALLCDLNIKEERLIFKTLDEAIDGIVVMTKGPEGLVVSDGKNLWRAGTFPEKEIVDRTGAGDAFGSGFVASFMKDGDTEKAIRFGSANATSKVEHLGARTGILDKKGFTDERWRKLEIKKEIL